jgi:hypothetical protein
MIWRTKVEGIDRHATHGRVVEKVTLDVTIDDKGKVHLCIKGNGTPRIYSMTESQWNSLRRI